ncbi:hypothetical protein [Agromyces sp. S2-1-8]|uniref:hypothetical protein n=1 Tax=Agromyces sp. S2-1-8 TaxID=2897180 RepID=UPI001E636AFF|nr:hypothetical protein [Agromyces sp. S2-1-8]MCD5345052.1 hypothetical protein [Agromyces sp. S2-1-8]
MARSNRIKGTKLALTLGTPGVDYWGDITQYLLTNEEADSDVTTFEDAAGGGSRDYKLTGAGVQSTDSASFWRYVWDNTGEEVPFTLAPHGNEVPSVAQPHFTGTVKIGPKPDIGGEAGTSAFTFEFEWDVIGEPVLDDGA